MPTVDYRSELQCLVAVRGHPFDRNAFAAMFEGMEGIGVTMVDQPAAALLMNAQAMRGFDVLVLYDMPGLDFDAPDGAPAYVDPPEALVKGLPALLEEGKGIVALHHALAGWPTWDFYGDLLGGRFFYHPGTLRGQAVPDSGYAHDVTQRLTPVAGHPVTRDLPASFTLTDEPYLAQLLEQDVTPLLHSDAVYTREHFFSAQNAVRGEMYSREGWDHAPGSNLVGWAKEAGQSRLVYLQPGDGAGAYENPHYRQLVENAIRWTARRRSE